MGLSSSWLAERRRMADLLVSRVNTPEGGKSTWSLKDARRPCARQEGGDGDASPPGAAGTGGKGPLKRGDISEISAIKETYGWLG